MYANIHHSKLHYRRCVIIFIYFIYIPTYYTMYIIHYNASKNMIRTRVLKIIEFILAQRSTSIYLPIRHDETAFDKI